ncbi:MAG: hypothetical protein EBW80_01845 [Burkholderiaceae bacterium]|nr:hypothetical protein [Burkholderiaceae bacterium]
MPVDYRAPLADMHFIVHQLIPLSRIQALPGFEEVDDDLVNTILEEASKFANQVLSPINWTGDQEGCILEHAVVKTPSGFKDSLLSLFRKVAAAETNSFKLDTLSRPSFSLV